MTAARDAAPPPPAPDAAGPRPVPIAPADPLSFVEDAPGFSAETIAILETPVNPDLVEARATQKDGPEKLLFVPWVHYQAILRKAFGPGGFRMVPRAVARQEGNVVTWVGALFVRPQGERKFQFIKEAKGECGMHGGMTMGNAAEGAQSDCLVKCCKGLGIFMELFDPAWRAAWERNHRQAYEARKRKADWVPRDRAVGGGAGGAAAASGGATASSSRPASSGGSASAATGGHERPEDDPGAPTGDTGEAASAEQLEAIRGRLKVLRWKWAFLRDWFKRHFDLSADKPERLLGALTQDQADAAFLLLNAFGQKALYDRVMAELAQDGKVRA